jgi:hypothetical protein
LSSANLMYHPRLRPLQYQKQPPSPPRHLFHAQPHKRTTASASSQ